MYIKGEKGMNYYSWCMNGIGAVHIKNSWNFKFFYDFIFSYIFLHFICTHIKVH